MERYPDEWERFLADPYAHRAPRAESYHDLSGELTDVYVPYLVLTLQSELSLSYSSWNDVRKIY